VDDQLLAGKHLQRRRRVEIAARHLAVRRGAADHLVVEKEEVLDRRGHRIQGGLALPRGEPDFEDAFLARQRYGLPELWSNCEIRSSLGILRPGSRAGTCKRHQDSDDTDCRQANQATSLQRVVVGNPSRFHGRRISQNCRSTLKTVLLQIIARSGFGDGPQLLPWCVDPAARLDHSKCLPFLPANALLLSVLPDGRQFYFTFFTRSCQLLSFVLYGYLGGFIFSNPSSLVRISTPGLIPVAAH